MLPVTWGKRLKMQESTQRSLCRLGFVVFAALPTLLTVAWSIWCMTPFSQMLGQSVWETHLARILGVSVQIDRVDVVAPNRYRFQGLQITHPETGKPIGGFERIELVASRETGKEAWLVRIHRGRMSVESLRYLVTQLHERWLCQPQHNYPRVHFIAESIDVSQGPDLLLESIRWESQFVGRRDQSVLECEVSWKQLPIESKSVDKSVKPIEDLARIEPLTFAATRQHLLAEPMTTWRLKTAGYTIPVSLLACLYGQSLALGTNVMLRGDLESKQTQYDWDLFINAAQISHVTWDQLTSSLPFRLLGNGGISIQQAYVLNGQVQTADATIESRNGSVSRAWLVASQKDLAMRIDPDVLSGSVTMVPFEAMKVRLMMDANGLGMAGAIPDPEGIAIHSIFADGRGGIVYEPEKAKVLWSMIARWLTNDPFDSTAFNQTAEVNPANPIQPASHQTSGSHSKSMARWLTTVLPSDSTTVQRR